MATDVITFSQMQLLAQAIAKSKLFGIENADQALALMAIAQGEGKHPAIVVRDFHIIQGKPSKKAEAMLRGFLTSGGKVEWHVLSDAIADATFSHPSGGSVRIAWDMKRAEAAGLAGNAMYKKYPRQMLRSRTVSEGCRTVAPFVTSGLYTPEEMQDIAQETGNVPRQSLEASIGAAAAPRLPVIERDALISEIEHAADAKKLRDAFGEAFKRATDARDGDAVLVINDAYNARKATLEAAKEGTNA